MCDKLRTPRRPPSIFGSRRSRIDQCPNRVVCERRPLLCNCGDADFQIGPPLLHCTSVTRDTETVPVSVKRQRIVFFAHDRGSSDQRLHSSSASRFSAGAFGFLILTQWAARSVCPLVFVSFCGHFVVLPHSQQIDCHLVHLVHLVCRLLLEKKNESGDFFNGFYCESLIRIAVPWFAFI